MIAERGLTFATGDGEVLEGRIALRGLAAVLGAWMKTLDAGQAGRSGGAG